MAAPARTRAFASTSSRLFVNICSWRRQFSISNSLARESEPKAARVNARLEELKVKLASETNGVVRKGKVAERVTDHPYIKPEHLWGGGRKVFFETYGCQMNFNDADIAWSILDQKGYLKCNDITQADVILVMTCAIREGAERKIWHRLQYLKHLKKKRENVKVAILGCMAERLKSDILEKDQTVDVVAGPDSYRDLPRLLAIADTGTTAVNVLLSLEETYADVVPVHSSPGSRTAFVSVMRGCDNMCTYCVVPFTRGRERSRPVQSVVEEIRRLSLNGVKQVTLLGQNVNSYRDLGEENGREPTRMSDGFATVYKTKVGGLRFADLLDKVSRTDPEMRIRFTSPHPKDFPDEVLHLLNERGNICKHVHLPAQCGSDRILEGMRRGYTRRAYLDLVRRIRRIVPGVSISSDFICGFCGETDEDFEETLTLIREVKYNFAYMFPYSMRERTHAHRKMVDDVPERVKMERLDRMVLAFRAEAEVLNRQSIGTRQLVLVEGVSKKSTEHLAGRNDGNTKVIFPAVEVPTEPSGDRGPIGVGDYVVVRIDDGNSQVLKGTPLYRTTLSGHRSGL